MRARHSVFLLTLAWSACSPDAESPAQLTELVRPLDEDPFSFIAQSLANTPGSDALSLNCSQCHGERAATSLKNWSIESTAEVKKALALRHEATLPFIPQGLLDRYEHPRYRNGVSPPETSWRRRIRPGMPYLEFQTWFMANLERDGSIYFFDLERHHPSFLAALRLWHALGFPVPQDIIDQAVAELEVSL